MPNNFRGAVAAVGGAVCAVALPAALNIAPAHGDPLPSFCGPASAVDNVCTARLKSVTANAVDGTITGSPVGGGPAITLAGTRRCVLEVRRFWSDPAGAGSTLGHHHRRGGQPRRRPVRSQLVRQRQGQSLPAKDAE
jgi:hypothetical protein